MHYAFDATFDDTGSTVLSAGDDGTIRTWALEPSAAVAEPVTGAAFSPDGGRVLAGGADGHARVWSTARLVPQLDLPDGTLRNIAVFSGDGRRIVDVAPDGAVWVHDAVDGRTLATLPPLGPEVWAVAVDAHGERVATAGLDTTVVVRPVAGGPPRILKGHTGPVYSVGFGPDGRSVVSGSADGTVRVWHDDGRVQIFSGHQGTVGDVAVNRDGTRLASAGADGTVQIWDLAREQQIALLRGHVGSANAVRFSPDGAQVISAGEDGTVRVWDVASQRVLLTLALYRGAASTVAFGADGRTIVSASEIDGVVRTMRCDVCGSFDEVLALARSRPPRVLTPAEEQRWVS